MKSEIELKQIPFILENILIGRRIRESLWLWPEEARKYLHTAPCSKSLETTGLAHAGATTAPAAKLIRIPQGLHSIVGWPGFFFFLNVKSVYSSDFYLALFKTSISFFNSINFN